MKNEAYQKEARNAFQESGKKFSSEQLRAYQEQARGATANLFEMVKTRTPSEYPNKNKFFSGSWYSVEGQGATPFDVRFQTKGVGREGRFPDKENVDLMEIRQETLMRKKEEAKEGEQLGEKKFFSIDREGNVAYIKSETYLGGNGEIISKEIETGRISQMVTEAKNPDKVSEDLQNLRYGAQRFGKVSIAE